MIAAKSGTILVTTGGGSITPIPALANINIAAAGPRNWTLNLHNELKPHNIYVAHVAISAWIGAGHPDAAPDVIAARYAELYETRVEPELHYVALDK
jgi:short-subunit dehydrogenase